MASGRGARLPARRRGLRVPIRAAERAVIQRRPVPGNSPDDRKDYPDFESSKESLRRCPPARPVTRTAARRECALLGERTLRFRGMAESFAPVGGSNRVKPGAGYRLPLVGPRAPVQGRDGRNCAPYSPSAMSSGRLFLDRVARQQSPSPLHRQPQNNTYSSEVRSKRDISTLPGIRHFYFALTSGDFSVDSAILRL